MTTSKKNPGRDRPAKKAARPAARPAAAARAVDGAALPADGAGLARDGAPDVPPDLTVVIPVYNEEAIVEEALRRYGHALDELGRSFEILVSANGCRDSTEQMRKCDVRSCGSRCASWKIFRLRAR